MILLLTRDATKTVTPPLSSKEEAWTDAHGHVFVSGSVGSIGTGIGILHINRDKPCIQHCATSSTHAHATHAHALRNELPAASSKVTSE